MTRMRLITLTLLGLPVVTGCADRHDERLVQVATDSTARQAEQNQEMMRLNREVAEGTRRLVAADSRSRQALVAVQQTLQGEQAEISRQRDRLDAERKELAQERRRDSVLAAALCGVGEVAVCALPLVLCWYLLHGLQCDSRGDSLDELLIEEIASERPRLLPRRGALLDPRKTIRDVRAVDSDFPPRE